MNGKLVVSEGEREKVYEICDARVVIGRGEGVDLRVMDQNVASAHCEIVETPRGFRLVDRETTNGTNVNGKTINQHMLKNGDTIEIGSTKMIFLGDSARAPAPPKRPPERVPPVLPKKEDGEPQRYYRHESAALRRKKTNPAMVGVVIGIIAVVAIILLNLGTSSFQTTAKKQWYDMLDLLKENTIESVARAQTILDSISSKDLDGFDRKIMQRDIAKSRLFLEETKARQAANRRYNEIAVAFKSGKENVKWLRIQVQRFQADHSGSEHAEVLQALLKRATYGTPQNELKWQEASNTIRTAVRTSNYRPAFARLKELEANKEIVAAFGEHLSVLSRSTRNAYARFHKQSLAEVDKASTSGNKERAREILQIIADIGQEPSSTQARDRLAKLK